MAMVDDLDRILVSEEPLVPSAGFAQRVMEVVRQSLDYVAPIGFPWWRFAAGLSLGLLCAMGSAAIMSHTVLSVSFLPDVRGAVSAVTRICEPNVLVLIISLLGTLLAVRITVESASS